MKKYNCQNINLNLGGGNTKMEGYLNLDILNLPNVDIVFDIKKGIPLKDNSVKKIYSSHFIEHIPDTVKLIEEMYRVCQPNALIQIKTPYFKSDGAFKDPTHVSFFAEKTFEYFDKTNLANKNLPDYQTKANLKIEKINYIWSYKWVRFLPFKKCFFLKHFWNIARTIYVELRVIKN